MYLPEFTLSKITNDILGMLNRFYSQGLDDIFKLINEAEKGALLFINQEQTPKIYLLELDSQTNAREGKEQWLRHEDGLKDFGIGAQILHDLNIKN